MSRFAVWRSPAAYPNQSVIIGATASILTPIVWALPMYFLGAGAAFPWPGANACQKLGAIAFFPLVVGGFASWWNMRLAAAPGDTGLRLGMGVLAILTMVIALGALLIFAFMVPGSLMTETCTTGN